MTKAIESEDIYISALLWLAAAVALKSGGQFRLPISSEILGALNGANVSVEVTSTECVFTLERDTAEEAKDE